MYRMRFDEKIKKITSSITTTQYGNYNLSGLGLYVETTFPLQVYAGSDGYTNGIQCTLYLGGSVGGASYWVAFYDFQNGTKLTSKTITFYCRYINY